MVARELPFPDLIYTKVLFFYSIFILSVNEIVTAVKTTAILLVMLDFGGGKTRLVNVCPYSNHVLGGAEEKECDGDGVLGLDRKLVKSG